MYKTTAKVIFPLQSQVKTAAHQIAPPSAVLLDAIINNNGYFLV
jgi:hypothetical protein